MIRALHFLVLWATAAGGRGGGPEWERPEAERELVPQIVGRMSGRVGFEDSKLSVRQLARLEAAGIRAVPSLQKSGRLNGMSYDAAGRRVKGSDLGRAYTALGLVKQKGLSHDDERDRGALVRAVREAATRVVARIRPERAHPDLRDRADRLRIGAIRRG